jgi:triacylglycerol lipase
MRCRDRRRARPTVRDRLRRRAVCYGSLLVASSLCAVASGTSAAAPATGGAAPKAPWITVSQSQLSAALTCHGDVSAHGRQPIIFAPGTGSDGAQVYALGKGAFNAIGRPVCVLDFPEHTTADVQISVQYLVYAVRLVARGAHQPVAIVGVSQGGLLARMALTYWPSLRPLVTDVVSIAGTQHGTTVGSRAVCAAVGCAPAVWQQEAGSDFLRALNDGRDETPGPTSWTTVRSATDELVQPTGGPRPTSSLRGASNILIQAVCPGRQTSHLGTAVDSVSIAAITDAVTHKGPARVSRLPRNVCSHPYGVGLNPARTALFLQIAQNGSGQGLSVPTVPQEPPVQPWAKLR